MKRSRYTEEQILFARKQAEAGQVVTDVCRQMGISETTFYVWKKKYANLGVLEVRELRQLRDENARLKRLVADLTLDRHILQEVVKKKDLAANRRRELALWTQDCFQISVRRSCRLLRVKPSVWYYRSRARDNSALRQRIRELAMTRPRFGYERIHILLRREGWRDSCNLVHRLYKLEGLQVRMRVRRRKRISLHRGPAPIATAGGQYWAMDFVHDQLQDGRKFRVLTVIDKWHRHCVALQADFALTGQSVVDTLEAVRVTTELPEAITVDHGTELTSRVLDEWCYLRDECLNVTEFVSLEHAREVLHRWREDYNHHRPHGSLGNLTPSEFARRGQKSDDGARTL